VKWVSRYDGHRSFDSPGSIAVSPDGSKVYVVGARPDAAGRLDYATIAYSARTGGTVWSRRYDGPAGLDDSPSDVFAASGAVFVSGSSFGSDATWGDFATVAYAQGNGTRLWVRRADGPAHGYDFVHAVDGSLDGSRVFVTGESDDRTGSGSSFSTVTYRGSTGERLWTRRYAKGSRSFALAGDATSDGSALYVTGVVTTTSANDFATIGYDGSTGERLWVRRYSSPGANTDTPLGVVVDPAATTVYVTGASYRGSDTGEDVTTFAYEASTGSTVWSRFYTSADANTDVGNAICVSPDGSQVFVAGSFDSSSPDLLTLAYTG
jgi:hypothetical protein